MAEVASPAHSRKVPAPSPAAPSPAVKELLARSMADRGPAVARYLLRTLCSKFGERPPVLPAGDLVGLAAAALAALGGADPGEVLAAAWESFCSDIPAIQVDKLLRGTIASDMPADVRSALRALAGHADKEHREAWPDRETLAGETGVGIRRVDIILRELVDCGWLTKVQRYLVLSFFIADFSGRRSPGALARAAGLFIGAGRRGPTLSPG